MGSRPPVFKNIPPPSGSKASTPYQRFIPREELGDFASWQPGSFGSLGGAAPGMANAAAAPAPAEPTAEDWAERVNAARQAGYHDGYRDGLAALENFKQAFAQQATAQIGALLEGFDQQLSELDAHIARALADTAVQVVRSELATQPALVARVAADAVGAVMLSARHIVVEVNPQDLPLVAEGAEEALAARGARLAANPTIERGGVMVQSDVGAVDARIAMRWSQAAAALGSALPFEDAEPDEAP